MCVCLFVYSFELMLYVSVNRYGNAGTFFPLHGTFIQQKDVMTSKIYFKNKTTSSVSIIYTCMFTYFSSSLNFHILEAGAFCNVCFIVTIICKNKKHL